MIRRASVVLIALVLNSTPLFGQGAAAPVAQLTVKSASAEVHKSPSVASAVIGTARVGTVLDVRRNLGSWVEVPWPNAETGIAFLHVNTGTISRGSASAAPNEAQAAIAQIRAVEAACITCRGGLRHFVSGIVRGCRCTPGWPGPITWASRWSSSGIRTGMKMERSS